MQSARGALPLPPVADAQDPALEKRLTALQDENARLRERLERIEARDARGKETRGRVVRGGLRLLLPAFDRQRVVRNFSQLAETASRFAGPRAEWPERERVVDDARAFVEAVVRFLVRRRLVFLVLGLLAAAVPALQVWLLVQQNRIIESQNELVGIQAYEIVARSMEGDRNAALVTGALLSNADPAFLDAVVRETFDPASFGVYRADGVGAVERRLEDAAYRGSLARAVARAVERRHAEGVAAGALFAETRPMLRRVLRDAADRVPEVLRLGRREGDVRPDLPERVDDYLAQVGALLRVYGRLARSAGEQSAFAADVAPLLRRVSQRRSVADSRFGETWVAVLQDFLFEVAVAPDLDDGPVDLDAAKLTPDAAIARGLERLRSRLGADAASWDALAAQVRVE